MRVIRGFASENIVACFNETTGGGDILDINAPCNAPAKSPHLYLDRVYWHTDFNQLELALPEQVVTITHPALAGRTIAAGTSRLPLSIRGNLGSFNHTLVTHNLGYTPLYMVAIGNYLLPSGHIIQAVDNLRFRNVCAYANGNIIGLRDFASASDVALPATSVQYRILIFKKAVSDPTKALMQFNGTTLSMARNKISSDHLYIRRTQPSESPYDLNLGPTIDITGGKTRVVTGGNVVSEPGYPGSFAGPPYVAVGIPR